MEPPLSKEDQEILDNVLVSVPMSLNQLATIRGCLKYVEDIPVPIEFAGTFADVAGCSEMIDSFLEGVFNARP